MTRAPEERGTHARADVRAAIDRDVMAWIAERPWRDDEVRFDRLARRIFAFQHAHCPAYGRFCAVRGATPDTIDGWRSIPAVPTGAFKEIALRCFPSDRTVKTFRTSGTTGEQRGALHLDTLDLYEASLLASLETLLLPDLGPGSDRGSDGQDGRILLRVLAPSAVEAPDSSLSHMFDVLVHARGGPGSGFDVRDGRLDADGLEAVLRGAAERGEPVALCGTAFAFVHLLERLEARGLRVACPPGSRVMETGGFKGRSRELSRDALHAWLTDRLGIPTGRIVNQYGMTELGSQFYDSVLVDPDGPRRKLGPPWARVRIVDPETGADAAPGETGMVVVHDLANTGSVAAIQTADLGRAVVDASGSPIGFEVLGRDPGAEARGCSIAADEMLAATAR
jgi:hypothetical protein